MKKNNGKNRKFERKDKNEKRRLALEKQNARRQKNMTRYGADNGAALVVSRTSDFNRRFVAAFLALVFAISTMVLGLNFATKADDSLANLTPTAIRQLGAGIISYGVPAQPGNMTLIAYLDNVTIMGVPGASISRPTTVFDALMPQVFAGDPLTKEDLINLGDGGACQMCKVCHFPNCTFGKY